MKNEPPLRDYGYSNATHTYAHSYVLPSVDEIISSRNWRSGARALDFGCGNGSMVKWLSERQFSSVGIDPSASGITEAKKAYEEIEVFQLSSNDDLSGLGSFDLVTSIEVIEHCYDPKILIQKIYDILIPGGIAILSTPYHGYLKNCALAFSGRMDKHFHALWEGGHIKFFSINTLTLLTEEVGFKVLEVKRVGRFGPLAKSMIFSIEKK